MSFSVITYPISGYFILGESSIAEIPIVPDRPISVSSVLCNVPAPGMFIIHESRIIYQQDPYGPRGVPGNPFKCREITKALGEKLVVEYTGYVPVGYYMPAKFLFTYQLISSRTFHDP